MHTARTARTAATSRTAATTRDSSDTARMTARYRDKNVNGTGAAALLNPKEARPKKGAKDHFRENIAAMREKQRENRLRKELSEHEAASDKFKLKRFEGVSSRLNTHRDTDGASVASKPFLRKASGTTAAAGSGRGSGRGSAGRGRPPHPEDADASAPFRRQKPSSKPPVPRAHEVAPLAPREEKDFIRSNYVKAPSAKGPASHRGASPGGSAGKREGYGEVPEYLRARKEEWADEEHRRAEAEANACPPGMTVMPESERIETLSVLKDSLAEANNVLARMPLVVETPGQVRRRTEMEAKIKELEDAIEIFSRDIVYVEED